MLLTKGNTMDVLTDMKLRELAGTCDPYCVSIYLPTHRAGTETKQDPLRLKLLLDGAENRLTTAGMRSVDARNCLEPARRLLDDGLFWSHQADGLAVFLTPSGMDYLRSAHSFEDLSLVGVRFHITPLFRLLREDTPFYILALSASRVHLLYATRDRVEPVEVEGMPGSFEELEEHIETHRSLQFHTRAAPTGGQSSPRAAVFHGQGVGTDRAQRKTRLLEFCQLVDNALRGTLAERRIPLVLAADSSLAAIYRRASNYPQIVDQVITGSPDKLSDKELHDAAWPVIRRRSAGLQFQALAEFGQAEAQNCASADVEDVLVAAMDGRIDKLLIADRRHCWGDFNPSMRRAVIHQRLGEGDEDLINVAAVMAYQKGSKVYTFEPEEMVDLGPVAAVFRY